MILTPSSGDFGHDVIATLTIPGHARVRIIESVKRYGPRQIVPANDVRALVGTMFGDRRVTGERTLGVVTTTAQFALLIERDPLIGPFLTSGEIKLVDGARLVPRLSGFA